MATLSPDPRTIVTPDAFSVHPSLLGTPLASPSRRGVALLIDIFLVALITTLTSGFWFILGGVAAAFFLTRAKKEGKKDRRANVLRFFLGCMGVMISSTLAPISRTRAPTWTWPYSDAASSDGSPAESIRWASALAGGRFTSPSSCPG